MANTIRTEYFAAPGGSQQVRYIGYANPGTDESVAMWRIARIDYDANDKPTKVLYADGNESFDNIWTNRAALVYS